MNAAVYICQYVDEGEAQNMYLKIWNGISHNTLSITIVHTRNKRVDTRER